MPAISPNEQRFVVPRLVGGLGNQLFQVVAGKAYARRTGRTLKLPRRIHDGGRRRTYHDSLFTGLATLGRLEQLVPRPLHAEAAFAYAPIPDHGAAWVELAGYFQSARYFERRDVGAVLLPSEGVAMRAAEVLRSLRARAEGRPLVAVHVRRGDYRYKSDYHPVLPLSYYVQALSGFYAQVAIAVFSDELDTCLTEAPFANGRAMAVDEPDVVSLLVMAGCDHHIIANSSFSWWGAYLAGSRGGRVLAPSPWFGPRGPSDTQDLIPEGWELLQCR